MTDGLAAVTRDGAITMGRLLCVDGHAYNRKYFAFTHMHSDHSEKLPKCLYNGRVYMTKPTRDLLEAIHDDNYGSKPSHIKKTQITTTDYETPVILNDDKKEIAEKMTFCSSSHVLGSSQIEIISNDKKIVYSGDITSDDKPPNGVHTLIVDSTHGHPKYARYSDPESMERRFIDKAEAVVCKDVRPVVIHAHRGKLQEVMSLISSRSELNNQDIKTLTSSTNKRVAKVYEKYKFKMPNRILDEELDEGQSVIHGDLLPFIQFSTSFHRKEYEVKGKAYSIFLVDNPTNQFTENDNTSVFLTTSHADFKGLIKYVSMSNAENVIVDGYRTKQAPKLVEELRKLGFSSVTAQP